jgi:transposase
LHPLDARLEAGALPGWGTKQGNRRQVEPDWESIHHALKRKHVTLSTLWEKYIARDLEGYRCSRFCASRTSPTDEVKEEQLDVIAGTRDARSVGPHQPARN